MIFPSFSLDFTTSALDPRVTFTRAAATATRVNSAGLIEVVATDTARFDYDPVSLVCRGLFVEETRQNRVLYSEDYTQASWSRTNLNVDATSTATPAGTSTTVNLKETSATGTHTIQQLFNYTAGTAYTYSFYAKADGRNKIRIFENALQGVDIVEFDLTAGTATRIVGVPSGWILNNFSIEPSANGFYRCWLSATPNSNITNNAFMTRIRLMDGASSSYAGDPTKGIVLYGVQQEVGLFPTSYIPTTTAAVTRNADVATITGTAFSDWWQASKGGVLVRARPGAVSGVRPWVQFDDGTANEIIALRGNTTNPELYIVDGGTPQAQIDAGTIAANTDYSLTGWWQTDDCKARLNNGAVVTDDTATIPTVTQARLGSDGTNYLNGHLASISYYDTFSGQIYTRRKNKAVFNLM